MIDRLQPFVPQRAQQPHEIREQPELFDLNVGPALDRTFDRFEGRIAQDAGDGEAPFKPVGSGEDARRKASQFHEEIMAKLKALGEISPMHKIAHDALKEYKLVEYKEGDDYPEAVVSLVKRNHFVCFQERTQDGWIESTALVDRRQMNDKELFRFLSQAGIQIARKNAPEKQREEIFKAALVNAAFENIPGLESAFSKEDLETGGDLHKILKGFIDVFISETYETIYESSFDRLKPGKKEKIQNLVDEYLASPEVIRNLQRRLEREQKSSQSAPEKPPEEVITIPHGTKGTVIILPPVGKSDKPTIIFVPPWEEPEAPSEPPDSSTALKVVPKTPVIPRLEEEKVEQLNGRHELKRNGLHALKRNLELIRESLKTGNDKQVQEAAREILSTDLSDNDLAVLDKEFQENDKLMKVLLVSLRDLIRDENVKDIKIINGTVLTLKKMFESKHENIREAFKDEKENLKELMRALLVRISSEYSLSARDTVLSSYQDLSLCIKSVYLMIDEIEPPFPYLKEGDFNNNVYRKIEEIFKREKNPIPFFETLYKTLKDEKCRFSEVDIPFKRSCQGGWTDQNDKSVHLDLEKIAQHAWFYRVTPEDKLVDVLAHEFFHAVRPMASLKKLSNEQRKSEFKAISEMPSEDFAMSEETLYGYATEEHIAQVIGKIAAQLNTGNILNLEEDYKFEKGHLAFSTNVVKYYFPDIYGIKWPELTQEEKDLFERRIKEYFAKKDMDKITRFYLEKYSLWKEVKNTENIELFLGKEDEFYRSLFSNTIKVLIQKATDDGKKGRFSFSVRVEDLIENVEKTFLNTFNIEWKDLAEKEKNYIRRKIEKLYDTDKAREIINEAAKDYPSLQVTDKKNDSEAPTEAPEEKP